MNTLLRTDHHEAPWAVTMPDAADLEATSMPLSAADKYKNEMLLDEIFTYMNGPVADVPAETLETVTFADVVSDYLADNKTLVPTRTKQDQYADAVLTNRIIMPSFFKTSDEILQNKAVVPETVTEIKQPVEEINDHLVWTGLGHIKNHDLEVIIDKADDRLLLQVDTQIAFTGLVRELNEKPDAFKKRVEQLDGDVRVEPEPIKEEPKLTDRNFWREVEAKAERRNHIKKLGRNVLMAAAVLIAAVPVGERLLSSATDFLRSKSGIVAAQSLNNIKGRLASDVVGKRIIPKADIPTTTSTVVTLENDVVTVTPAPEAVVNDAPAIPSISLADIAAEAKAKADAEDLAAAEAAAEAARRKALTLTLGELCGTDSVSSPMGMRWHPIHEEYRPHTGTDLRCEVNADVKAYKSGTVTLASWNGGYGKTVIVNHGEDENGDEISTLYAHLNEIDVEPGDEIEPGDDLGDVGSTGDSTGPHLHFEIRKNGTPVNPEAQ